MMENQFWEAIGLSTPNLLKSKRPNTATRRTNIAVDLKPFDRSTPYLPAVKRTRLCIRRPSGLFGRGKFRAAEFKHFYRCLSEKDKKSLITLRCWSPYCSMLCNRHIFKPKTVEGDPRLYRLPLHLCEHPPRPRYHYYLSQTISAGAGRFICRYSINSRNHRAVEIGYSEPESHQDQSQC